MDVEATTESPLATGADTIAVGVFEDEGVAHDVAGGLLAALLDSGEARRRLAHVAVTHLGGQRLALVGLGPRDQFDAARARA
ncbi:MAG: leucyl aminopeptidase, partial [Actinomycetota bacterium]|nr:leucyl aminopeptidase [Actinomycetota bacterium]